MLTLEYEDATKNVTAGRQNGAIVREINGYYNTYAHMEVRAALFARTRAYTVAKFCLCALIGDATE